MNPSRKEMSRMAEEKTREVGGPGNRGKRPMEKPKNVKRH